MTGLQLQTIGELMRFECALCGRGLEVGELLAHAHGHVQRDECLTYSQYDGACRLDTELEGYPLTMPDGSEVVWPFRLDAGRLTALRVVPRAG